MKKLIQVSEEMRRAIPISLLNHLNLRGGLINTFPGAHKLAQDSLNSLCNLNSYTKDANNSNTLDGEYPSAGDLVFDRTKDDGLIYLVTNPIPTNSDRYSQKIISVGGVINWVYEQKKNFWIMRHLDNRGILASASLLEQDISQGNLYYLNLTDVKFINLIWKIFEIDQTAGYAFNINGFYRGPFSN